MRDAFGIDELAFDHTRIVRVEEAHYLDGHIPHWFFHTDLPIHTPGSYATRVYCD
jgi:hypothetical protein